jgi:hypothetical protein
MRRRLHILLEKLPEETIRWEELFCIEKTFKLLQKGYWLIFFLQLEQYMLFITVNDLCSLAFECAELNHFPHTPSEDRDCWKETALWVLRDTSITKCEAITC